ncbi:MAG TPA: glycosyltransferase family 2 protein [Vicinamibacterales bacterium]|nr:glycosyltransferase family 2 protein [Vicinamibacterales bacterium]
MALVVALIPALNEAGTIRGVVEGVRPHVSAVVVVDDGSTDDTSALAEAGGAVVLKHERVGGKGRAIRTGLEHVLAHTSAQYVLILDGDMQHLPEEAPRLIAAARAADADLVVGVRRFEPGAMPRSRYHANVIGSRALSSFVGVPLEDTQCGYRLFRTEMLRRMRLRATGYDIETEMLIKVGRLGGRIVQAPISAVYGGARSKLRPVRDTTRTCFRAVYYRYIERL